MELNGTIINNRYNVIEKIAESRMSHMWLTKDEINNKQVAIKLLKKESTSNRIENIFRFYKEVRIISKLTHENILAIYKAGEFSNILYIVMEYIQGKSIF